MAGFPLKSLLNRAGWWKSSPFFKLSNGYRSYEKPSNGFPPSALCDPCLGARQPGPRQHLPQLRREREIFGARAGRLWRRIGLSVGRSGGSDFYWRASTEKVPSIFIATIATKQRQPSRKYVILSKANPHYPQRIQRREAPLVYLLVAWHHNGHVSLLRKLRYYHKGLQKKTQGLGVRNNPERPIALEEFTTAAGASTWPTPNPSSGKVRISPEKKAG